MKLTNPERFNIDLAERVIDAVTRFPERHHQANFWCGTSGCLAGWAWHLTGEVRYADARKLLGLTCDEFGAFYAEMDEQEAIAILADYIEQAKVAQYARSEMILVGAPS